MDKKIDEIDFNRLTQSSRIILNVGGEKHDVRWETLNNLPNSRLGRLCKARNIHDLLELCDEIDFINSELYFDRPAKSFNAIIDFYRTGKLHTAQDLCIISFHEDLIYWGIDDHFFSPCCNLNYHQLKENALEEIVNIDQLEKADLVKTKEIEITTTTFILSIVSVVSIFFVVISTCTLVLSTIQYFKKEVKMSSDGNRSSNQSTITNYRVEYVDNEIFENIEIICIAWFSFEYVLRIWSFNHKWRSIRSPLNIIDLISIVPFYVSIILNNIFDTELSETDSMRRIFTLFRILRVLRIFKLARHSKGLKAFGLTIHKSSDELGMLFFFLSIQVLLFSTIVYFAEKDEISTTFTSIPATSWWAVISITTVGYGDMVPSTFLGRFFGAFCCISGILVVATPIPIIVRNFTDISQFQNKSERVLRYKHDRENKVVLKLSESMKRINKVEPMPKKKASLRQSFIKKSQDLVK